MECYDSEDEENMIVLVEWIKGKKILYCPFGKRNQNDSASISPRPIKYLICCFSKGRLSSLSSIPYYLQKNLKGCSIAGGIM
jgi:hypothetical protein